PRRPARRPGRDRGDGELPRLARRGLRHRAGLLRRRRLPRRLRRPRETMTPRVSEVRVGTAILPLPAELRLGPMVVTEREYAAVEVETDDGLVGKAYCLTRNAPVAACVERLVAPVVVGREADPGPRWEECSRGTVAIGRTGLVVRAIGLVDIAL